MLRFGVLLLSLAFILVFNNSGIFEVQSRKVVTVVALV